MLRQSKTMKKAGITITEDVSNKAYIPGKKKGEIKREPKNRVMGEKNKSLRNTFFEAPKAFQVVPKCTPALEPNTPIFPELGTPEISMGLARTVDSAFNHPMEKNI